MTNNYTNKKYSGITIKESDHDRFWSKINIKDKSECWVWMACLHKTGYGSFKIGGKKGKVILAHRFSAFLSHETFYEEMQYLHSCDNPSCCNPNHLRPGTMNDNMKDRTERNRNRSKRHGNGYTKIDDEKRNKIMSMKIDGKNNSEIGRIMNITPTRVYQIYNEYIDHNKNI